MTRNRENQVLLAALSTGIESPRELASFTAQANHESSNLMVSRHAHHAELLYTRTMYDNTRTRVGSSAPTTSAASRTTRTRSSHSRPLRLSTGTGHCRQRSASEAGCFSANEQK